MSYKLLENWLPKSYVETIKREFENLSSWQFGHSSSGVGDNYDKNDPMIFDSVQFIHPIVENNEIISNIYSLIFPIMLFLEKETGRSVKNMIRIKANCLTRDGIEEKYNAPHIDLTENGNFWSLVYFVNDSDGDTFLFDKSYPAPYDDLSVVERISPKAGNAVLLPSNLYHASSNPIKSQRRIVINHIFEIE
jgi:hypothetical protein